jgi:hypothetical protein
MTKTMLVIDTDTGFPEKFRSNLLENEIADQYEIETLAPDTRLDPTALVDDCVSKTLRVIASKDIVGIFVDMVIYESGGSPLDTSGIKLAKSLRGKLPNVPIFNITGKYLGREEADAFSESTLEDVDGVFVKTFLDGKAFSEARLKKVLSRARAKRMRYRADDDASGAAYIPESAQHAFGASGLDPRIKPLIEEIGEGQFWNLLLTLLPGAEGALSFMQPGRSGAFVFKVKAKFIEDGLSATRPKGWIIKLARRRDLLERELKNYLEMTKTPLNRSFYPKSLHSEPVVVGNTAGIAIELEDEASPLLEKFNQLSEDDVETVVSGISIIMRDSYGDPMNKVCKVWQEFYTLHESARTSILAFFAENEKLIESLGFSQWKQVHSFVLTNGEINNDIFNFEDEVDRRTIHGDFNSRNILVRDDKQLIVIDFFSRGLGPITKDAAKLERDIVFRIFDSQSPNYFEWSRMAVWQNFSRTIERGKVFSSDEIYDINDEYLKRTIKFIYAIRNTLRQHSPNLSEKQYLCALLYYSLLALAHPEISIHKKVFAVQYVSDILSNLG